MKSLNNFLSCFVNQYGDGVAKVYMFSIDFFFIIEVKQQRLETQTLRNITQLYLNPGQLNLLSF